MSALLGTNPTAPAANPANCTRHNTHLPPRLPADCCHCLLEVRWAAEAAARAAAEAGTPPDRTCLLCTAPTANTLICECCTHFLADDPPAEFRHHARAL